MNGEGDDFGVIWAKRMQSAAMVCKRLCLLDQ